MSARRHDRTRRTAPERAADGRSRSRSDHSGAIAWFNLRERHTAAGIPGTMATALAAALSEGRGHTEEGPAVSVAIARAREGVAGA